MLPDRQIEHKDELAKMQQKIADNDFTLQGIIDLTSKDCDEVEILPLKDSRVAIVLKNKFKFLEAIIFDCANEKIITIIPNRIIVNNEIFDLYNERINPYINQLPNDNILITYHSSFREKHITLIWDPLTHSCKQVLDECCIRALELSDNFFISANDAEFSLYKQKQDSVELCWKQSWPHNSRISLSNDEFVICGHDGSVYFFQIKNEKLYNTANITQEGRSLTKLYFLKEQNQLIVVRTLSFYELPDEYQRRVGQENSTVIDIYDTLNKKFISRNITGVPDLYFDVHLLPDKTSLLLTNRHSMKGAGNYIYNIETKEPAKPSTLFYIDFKDCRKKVTVLESGHILISSVENNIVTQLQIIAHSSSLELLRKISAEKIKSDLEQIYPAYPIGIAKIIAAYRESSFTIEPKNSVQNYEGFENKPNHCKP